MKKTPPERVTDAFINEIQTKEVRDLLAEAKNNGFKIETAEDMYFPVLDYSLYRKYRPAVTQDFAAYIDIMATESEQAPAKDAALRINWEEVIQRALKQEAFIKMYSTSTKLEEVRQQLKQYVTFALYGSNNTPLFSYDTKQMVPAAKQVYMAANFDVSNGSFSKIMNEYLGVLQKNNYKLTGEVQAYRNKAAEGFR